MRRNWTAIAIVSAAIILVIGAYLVGQSIWIALTAVGTIGAVLVALFYPWVVAKLQRPVLEISPFGVKPPYLRQVPEVNPKTEVKSIAYYLTLVLQNTGRTIAKNAQPFLTKVGKADASGKWEAEDDWIPVPLLWVFDELTMLAEKKSTEERDLVPERPYLFNLLATSTTDPQMFWLLPIIISRDQRQHYDPGEFCFEITAFAEGAVPARKYFHIQWDGGCTKDLEEVKKRIRVFPLDDPPW